MLNVIWVICCVPIVTIGASTAALYEVIRELREGHDAHILRRFIAVFPHKFGKNLTVTVIYLAFFALTFFDLWYLSKYMGDTTIGAIAYGAVCAIALVLLTAACFVLPVAARSKLSVRAQFSQSFAMAIRHVGTALTVTLLLAIPVVIAVVIPGGLPFVMFFWGLLFSGISAWLILAVMVRAGIIADAAPKPSTIPADSSGD